MYEEIEMIEALIKDKKKCLNLIEGNIAKYKEQIKTLENIKAKLVEE